MEKNDVFTAACGSYTSEGLGVVRLDGRAVFVKNLLVGEEAGIKLIKVSKTAAYGRVERLISASPERIEPDCPVYRSCGGCGMRHMSYAEELRFKKQRVEDAFRRIGGLDLVISEIIGAENISGYRNKTIYTVGRDASGRAVTGFYRERSHDLIPAPDCRIESDYARRAAGALRAWMDKLSVPAFDERTGSGVRRLMCRFGFSSGEGQAVIVTGRGSYPFDTLVSLLRESCPETVSVVRNINDHPGDTVLTHEFTTLWGRETVEDELCSLRFTLAPDAFYQVNRPQAERLYGRALEYAELTGSERVLDLYCGTGTITLCLAKRAGEAVGAEIVESAVENARKNAERNGVKNTRFICADAGEAASRLAREGFRPDVVVVDPPRKGLLPEVPGIIASMEPERIVYVSCDPATLARDLRAFTERGYAPVKATAVDMFPRTAHVETVVLMTKNT